MGFISLLLTQFLLIESAHAAFEFGPIIATLAPSGPKATVSFKVTNLGNEKIPVQIAIFKREPDIEGKEEYKESDEIDEIFRVFPNQLVLNPKESRAVRVTYVGSPKITKELPFRIIAEEIPIDLDDPKKVYKKAVARISIAVKYVGSIYVTPPGAKHEVAVEAKKAETGKNSLILEMVNKGTAHLVLRNPTIKIKNTSTNKEVSLSREEVRSLFNQNILAGRSRRFTLDWPKSLQPGPLKVSLDVPKD